LLANKQELKKLKEIFFASIYISWIIIEAYAGVDDVEDASEHILPVTFYPFYIDFRR